jgi:hypothetical protein
MVNFGYGPGMKGWDDKKAPLLAQRLQALLKTMESARKFDGLHEGIRPYIEIDGMYEGIRIRKITHLRNKVCDELIEEAEKIYHDVMFPTEPKKSQVALPGLPWRKVDNMLASSCIQLIQKEWHLVHKVMRMMSFENEHEEAAAFSAWRVGMLERMEQEYDKNEWAKVENYNPRFELWEDIQHYNELVKKSHK